MNTKRFLRRRSSCYFFLPDYLIATHGMTSWGLPLLAPRLKKWMKAVCGVVVGSANGGGLGVKVLRFYTKITL